MNLVQLILLALSYFVVPVSTRFNCAEEDYCLNEGICEGTVIGAETVVTRCRCSHMYTGPRCEYKKCSRDPCQNGGFCELVGRSLFRCHCQQGILSLSERISPLRFRVHRRFLPDKSFECLRLDELREARKVSPRRWILRRRGLRV